MSFEFGGDLILSQDRETDYFIVDTVDIEARTEAPTSMETTAGSISNQTPPAVFSMEDDRPTVNPEVGIGTTNNMPLSSVGGTTPTPIDNNTTTAAPPPAPSSTVSATAVAVASARGEDSVVSSAPGPTADGAREEESGVTEGAVPSTLYRNGEAGAVEGTPASSVPAQAVKDEPATAGKEGAGSRSAKRQRDNALPVSDGIEGSTWSMHTLGVQVYDGLVLNAWCLGFGRLFLFIQHRSWFVATGVGGGGGGR